MTTNKNNTFFEEENEASDSLFKTKVNCGLILHIPLEEIDNVKRNLLQLGCTIVYQRVSTEPLWVCQDKPKV